MQQQEMNVLLVAHGGLLKMMMNDHPNIVLVDGRTNKQQSKDVDRCISQRFGNCELRSYIISAWKNTSLLDVDNCMENSLPVITLEEVSM
jgi:hypothetical protein